MVRRLLRRWLPDPATLRTYRSLRWMGPLLDRPRLWHVNRDSISSGLAIGMFFGIVAPFGQALLAGIAAIVFRANLPAAALATFVSNPLTTPVILLAAYQVGATVAGEAAAAPVLAEDLGWAERISAMGEALLIGLPLLAIVAAVVTYFGVRLAWRLGVVRQMAARRAPSGGRRGDAQ